MTHLRLTTIIVFFLCATQSTQKSVHTDFDAYIILHDDDASVYTRRQYISHC